jgi:rare lipoprotein A
MGECLRRLGGLPLVRSVALVGLCLGLANCVQTSGPFARKVDPKYGVSASERLVEYGDPVPKGGGTYRVGKPYVIGGQTYIPEENRSYVAEGLASWYGDDFHGRRTANGELFDMDGLSAAHPTLPMPSYVRVTNLSNRKSVIVRVNDRGPYHSNRLIDVSRKTAHLLGFRSNGVARVRVEYVGQASLDGSDDRLLEATLREGEPAPVPSAVRLASAKPFPFIAPTRTAALRGDVPVPAGRPYTLGEEYPVSPEPADAPQTRPAQQSAQISPAVSRQPEPVRNATLLPRTLTQQAQALSEAPAESGFRPNAGALPAATSAFAPVSAGRSSGVSGLY